MIKFVLDKVITLPVDIDEDSLGIQFKRRRSRLQSQPGSLTGPHCLIWMLALEGSDESWVSDELSLNPKPLLWTIYIPADEVPPSAAEMTKLVLPLNSTSL